jgi:hypothetical protein
LHIVSIVSHDVKVNMIGYIILHCTLLVLSHMMSKQHDWLYNITLHMVSIYYIANHVDLDLMWDNTNSVQCNNIWPIMLALTSCETILTISTWVQSQHDWLYNITLHIVSIVSHEVKANIIGYIILHCILLVLFHMMTILRVCNVILYSQSCWLWPHVRRC